MRVLIVDDHTMFCEGLKLFLQTIGAVSEVATCTQGSEALSLVQSQSWDLVLLDWNLGHGSASGDQLIRQFLKLQPNTRVVVISADTSPSRVRSAVDAGAVGFVPKEASADLLIAAIQMTSLGGIYLPTCVLDLTLDATGIQPTENSLPREKAGSPPLLQQAYPRLTPRQIDVLVCAVRGQSNKLIARALDISDGTVKQHLNAVYRELGVNSRTEVIYRLAQKGVQVF